MGPTHAERVQSVLDMYPHLHPSTAHLVPYFDFDHFTGDRAEVSAIFYDTAHVLIARSHEMSGPELTVALRKLLEAKDAAVRATL